MKYLLICQSLNQLDKAYGTNNAVVDNCGLRVTYAAADDRTAERIKAQLGTASLVRETFSESRPAGGLAAKNSTTSYQEYGRPLKTVDELLSLQFPFAILMKTGLDPYLGRKILYYQDSRFKPRAWDTNTGANAPLAEAEIKAQLPRPQSKAYWQQLEDGEISAPCSWASAAPVAKAYSKPQRLQGELATMTPRQRDPVGTPRGRRGQRGDSVLMKGKARVQPYLTLALREKLALYCARKRVSESAVVEAALQQYLEGTSDMTLLFRRLDAVNRSLERVHRDVLASAELANEWIRVWYRNTPPLPVGVVAHAG
jgi:hypothetical protein